MSDKEQIDEAFGRDGRAFSLFKQDFQGKPSFVVEERDASGNVVKSSGFDNESDARDHVKDQQGAFFMQQSRGTVPATADLGKPSSTGGVSQPGADATTGDNTPDNASAPTPATAPVKEATEPTPGSQNDPETNATPKQDI